ncbi:MAG: hypothetical protein HY811_08835 [Planctomycetes bacterium]|nr:hypothetical protein [Planctomycetota bacterium]
MSAKTFRSLFIALIDFLSKEKSEYVIIGGVASDIWGRPRKTLDIDIVIRLSPEVLNNYRDFLSKISRRKFTFNPEKALKQMRDMGMCRLYYGHYHVDFIMGYSEFEKTVFQRKRRIEIFRRKVFVASPEDVILYKLVSYRAIDQADISNIILSQKGKLDKGYLKKRIIQMQKDLMRTDIKENLEKLIKNSD